jgi:hypothetical protein|tara:strand:+ start:383 stop:646 length:264 start_codon:yes stop_codon:yes gene_type:complete
MIKELKYLFFIAVIFIFFFLAFRYYFSDDNKKNSYRSLKLNDKRIITFSQNLVVLSNNTNDVVKYIEKTIDENKKNYNFWELINNDE